MEKIVPSFLNYKSSIILQFIFSTKYWVGYFLPQLVSAGIFLNSELPCRIFFQNHQPPPIKSEMVGPLPKLVQDI